MSMFKRSLLTRLSAVIVKNRISHLKIRDSLKSSNMPRARSTEKLQIFVEVECSVQVLGVIAENDETSEEPNAEQSNNEEIQVCIISF